MHIPVTPPSKAARAGLTVVTCLLSLAVASEASASVRVGSAGSPSQVLQHSLAAATKAGSARISVEFFSGSTTGRVLQDSSMQSGQQAVAIGKALATTVLVGGTAFISGNAQGMTSFFGLPSALGSTLAGQWISLQSSDSNYQAVAANVTLASALTNVTPTGTLIAGKRKKISGQWVRSITGKGQGGAGRVTLFVTADARSLPFEAVQSVRVGSTLKGEIVKFSKWGEPINVAAPSKAIPISAIQAASSASG